MIVKKEFQDYLKKEGLDKKDFAVKIKVSEAEVDKLCGGEVVDYDTAKKFVKYFGAYKAQAFIDWEKMNIQNPLEDERGENDER